MGSAARTGLRRESNRNLQLQSAFESGVLSPVWLAANITVAFVSDPSGYALSLSSGSSDTYGIQADGYVPPTPAEGGTYTVSAEVYKTAGATSTVLDRLMPLNTAEGFFEDVRLVSNGASVGFSSLASGAWTRIYQTHTFTGANTLKTRLMASGNANPMLWRQVQIEAGGLTGWMRRYY